MSSEIHLPEKNITSAATRLRMDVPTLAEEIGIAKKKADKFVRGIMTRTQAEKLAKMLEIPFGFLYLPELPKPYRPDLPDFRTVLGAIPLNIDFYDTLTDIRRKLDWYTDYLQGINEKEKLPFVGKFSLRDTVKAVVADIRNTIGFVERPNKDSYMRNLVQAFEQQGVLVFRSGIVGNATKRALEPKMFRGFAIADPYTPAIFINTKDAHSAQLFTLIHEAAHIWLGESAISSPSIVHDEHKVERFCNQVAAEFLLPKSEFLKQWRHRETLGTNLAALSKEFCISKYVVIIKALEQAIVSPEEFTQWQQENKDFSEKNKNSGGGDFYRTLPVRNSRRLTDAIANAAQEKRILLRDGAQLINTRPEKVINYLERR